jgi:hypothetical protein
LSELNLISPKQLYNMLNESLDCPIGINRVYSLIHKRGFPSIKIGGKYYVFKDRVEGWFLSQPKEVSV